jgi:AcrR family transcriptional regulator
MANSSDKIRRPVGRPRNDGKPHLTRRRVFEVCAKLIAEQGFAGTGIRTMAQALDASPASLFNLFGSKEGLLNELIAYAARPALEFYEQLGELNVAAPVGLYKSVFEEVLAVASADQDHVALFYLPELRQPQFKAAQQVRAAMVEHYRVLIAGGIAQGSFVTVDAMLAAEQVFQLTETSIIAGAATVKLSPEVQAVSTANFCLRALLADTGALAGIQAQAAQLPVTFEV